MLNPAGYDVRLEYLKRAVYGNSLVGNLLGNQQYRGRQQYQGKQHVEYGNPKNLRPSAVPNTFLYNFFRNLANQWRYMQDNVSNYHNAAFPPTELMRKAVRYKPQQLVKGNSEAMKNNEQQKQTKNNHYSYNSQYNMPYIKSTIDVGRQRAKTFYRELGSYVSRLFRKLRPKKESSATYNSPEALPKTNNPNFPVVGYQMQPKKYQEKTPQYKPRVQSQQNNQDEGYDTLDDIVDAA